MKRSPTIELDDHVAPDLRALIWNEFFASRGRGRSLADHSPWLDATHGVTAVSAHERASLSGCLIIKDHEIPGQARTAMIGYVCVRPDRRGQGIADALVGAARDLVESRGLEGLVLWTQTPSVYRKHGFLPDNRDVFVQFPPAVAPHRAQTVKRRADFARGMPAFATAASAVGSDHADAIVLQTTFGPAIAEWTGPDADVADLLAGVVSASWWLNALAEDTLPDYLAKRLGPPLRVNTSTRQVLPLNGATVADIPGIRLLDRI